MSTKPCDENINYEIFNYIVPTSLKFYLEELKHCQLGISSCISGQSCVLASLSLKETASNTQIRKEF